MRWDDKEERRRNRKDIKKMHLFGECAFVVSVKTHIHVSTMHVLIVLTIKKEISDIISGDNKILNGEWLIIA